VQRDEGISTGQRAPLVLEYGTSQPARIPIRWELRSRLILALVFSAGVTLQFFDVCRPRSSVWFLSLLGFGFGFVLGPAIPKRYRGKRS
jgi:hypothetical protein